MTTTPAEIARRALADHLAALPSGQLLKRYATSRDPEAFAGLVQQFGPLVLGTCRRVLGPDPDADDAFQAVFLALARHADSFRDAETLPAWLHRVSLRVSRKALARRSSEPKTAADSPEPVDPADPFADVAWKDMRRVLDEELDLLAEKYRGPVVLCWLDGLTQDEAATRLGISLNTLKRRLDAGRELLRSRLVGRGLAPVLVTAVVATPTGLHAVVPEALRLLAVELGVGGDVPAGLGSLAIPATATAPTRRVVLTALLGAGAAAACGLAYTLTRARSPEGTTTAPAELPGPEVAPTPRLIEPRRVTAPRTRLALNSRDTLDPLVAWSQDGTRIATHNSRETIQFWDATSGKEFAAPIPAEYTYSMAWHPGGKLIAYGTQRTVKVWDVEAGKLIATLSPPEGWRLIHDFRSLAWSPDGTTLATANHAPRPPWENNNPIIRLWDIATEKAREIQPGHRFEVWPFFSPDSKILACVGWPGYVTCWKVATGSAIAQHMFANGTEYFGWSEDAALLLVSSNSSSIISWNPVTGAIQRELDIVTSLRAVSGDGNVCAWLTVNQDTLCVVDWRRGRVRALVNCNRLWPRKNNLAGFRDNDHKVRLSRDGNTLMTFWDRDVLLWDVSPEK